ncbi:hypothetical protein [Streptomyces tailanensis]|nr:hypothetical protein [Streptomyces tailanensis]
MFGKVTVVRIAYRGTGVADLSPADAVLNQRRDAGLKRTVAG